MTSKIVRLVQLLHRKTLDNEIQWARTEKEGVFQHAFPDYAVRLSSRWEEFAADPDYIVTIYNENGAVIEEVTDVDAKEEGLENAYDLMRDMYSSARRSAMGIDKALDDLLTYLDDNSAEDIPF